MQIRLGYACINTELTAKNITTNRSIQRKTFLELGLKKCSEVAIANSADLLKILQWNIENSIYVYRMSSDIIPWHSEYSLRDLPEYSSLVANLEAAGKYARETNTRLSFHPGPFNCLASSDSSVIAKAVRDLDNHAEILDIMGMPSNHMSKINIHIGGAYGDKPAAMGRFAKNFKLLGESTRARLTLENDDRESMYGVLDLYSIYKYIGCPIVFDGHHYLVGAKNNLTYEEAYSLAYNTWDCTPCYHWSNSAKDIQGDTTSSTAHSNYYTTAMPLLDLGDVDIMLEAKMKEDALIMYRNKFKV